MSKKRIKPPLEKLVLRLRRKTPHLGVRALADLIARKHKFKISKSAVHKILKSKGIQLKAGPKKALSLYAALDSKQCGLILLRALDEQIGLSEHLKQELGVYFPKISRDLLGKLIILTSFSSLLNKDLFPSLKEKGFLRLGSLEYLPVYKLKYFVKQLIKYKPIVSLAALKKELRLVSSLKFYFRSGYCSYCDAKMSTFWDGPCDWEHFFLPLRAARLRIKEMLAKKVLFVGYTKSFEYLSGLVIGFVKGLSSGLEKCEFLNQQGKVLDQIEPDSAKVSLFFGYYPKILAKGMIFPERLKRFRRIFWPALGELFGLNTTSKFIQSKIKVDQDFSLNNILIKEDKAGPITWGFLSTADINNQKLNSNLLIKKYLYFWPYPSQGFFKDMKIIEKSFLSLRDLRKEKGYSLERILPGKLQFREIKDFLSVASILSVMFKEIIWGWEPKGRSGSFSWGRDYIGILLKPMPKEAKESFNQACLSIEGKRAFVW